MWTSPGSTGAGRRLADVTKAMLERRLSDVATQLRELRRELAVSNEQLAHLADQADDARLRSLVSETPIAEREHRDAARHAEAMERHRTEVQGSIEDLERQQDDLLDRLNEAVG
jgi:chromosome segregation ATPase